MARRTNRASGDFFGPFQVHEQLGFGGMAMVHRATKVCLDGTTRAVALKRILPHLAHDTRFVANLKHEARLGLLLEHGNIVRVYEQGQVGDEHYIAMEHIEGWNLRQILKLATERGHHPSPSVAHRIVLLLSQALAYAHERKDELGAPLGLVHRDISPANVIITRGGEVKIIDFGIAHTASAQPHEKDRGGTQNGAFKGKLGYMAPEAIIGATIDARADIWSLGVLAHELVTGRSLFDDGSDFGTIERVRTLEIPHPTGSDGGWPLPLAAIILRALEREVDRRWQSAGAMALALEEFAAEISLPCDSETIAEWCKGAMASAGSTSSRPTTEPGLPATLVPMDAGLAAEPAPARREMERQATPLPLPPPPWTPSPRSDGPAAATAASNRSSRLTFRPQTISESPSRVEAMPVPPAGMSYLHARVSGGVPTSAEWAREEAAPGEQNGEAGASSTISPRSAPASWPVGTISPPLARRHRAAANKLDVATPQPLPSERPTMSSSALRELALPLRSNRRLAMQLGAGLCGVLAIALLIFKLTGGTGDSKSSPRAEAAPAELSVVTTPAHAAIFVDGKQQRSPVQLPPGTYHLEIRADDFQSFHERLVVRPGEALRFRIALARAEN